MSFRLVSKSVTLNNLETIILRYFTEFDKPAFQHITASARIELIHQKSASITHTCRAVKFGCSTAFGYGGSNGVTVIFVT